MSIDHGFPVAPGSSSTKGFKEIWEAGDRRILRVLKTAGLSEEYLAKRAQEMASDTRAALVRFGYKFEEE